MKRDLKLRAPIVLWLVLILALSLGVGTTLSQSPAVSSAGGPATSAKPMTIPITIRVKGIKSEPELQTVDLTVHEDGEPQTILSIRAIGTNAPITLAVLIQDDLVSSVSHEIGPLGEFIRGLPRGSRVLVGYLRSGSLQVRQKFTTDLEKASKALRAPLGVSSVAPYNPFTEVVEATKRFDSQPSGRRAILLVSDGLDVSRGFDSSSASQSLDLQRAINEAQRRSIAVYAFWAPTVGGQNSILTANAQGALQRLSDETGGRAFFQGTGPPVSFDPFIKDLNSLLARQIAVTYLSTHLGKGFHRIQVRSATPSVEVNSPSGYTRQHKETRITF
jgi:VWFA-related protein